MTALTRLGMLSIRWVILSCGIASHFACSNPASWAKFFGRDTDFEISRPSSSHACSMGLRSGLREGQGIDLTPRADLKSLTILARCGAALSSCNFQPRLGVPRSCVAHGMRWSFKTLMYDWPVTNPPKITSLDLPFLDIAPHTCTEPQPCEKASVTQFSR